MAKILYNTTEYKNGYCFYQGKIRKVKYRKNALGYCVINFSFGIVILHPFRISSSKKHLVNKLIKEYTEKANILRTDANKLYKQADKCYDLIKKLKGRKPGRKKK